MNPAHPWPPPSHAHGHLEAREPGGEWRRVFLYYRGDLATWCEPDIGVRPWSEWRWTGPAVPPPESHGSAILTWRWQDAPGELRALSSHGVDEDWLSLVPVALADEDIGWMEGGAYGCCDVSRDVLADGRVVVIGAHA